MGIFVIWVKKGGWSILFERIDPLERLLCLGSLPVSE